MDEVLDERKRKILKAIIKTYMETGEPVGSRTISKYSPTPQPEEFHQIKAIAFM